MEFSHDNLYNITTYDHFTKSNIFDNFFFLSAIHILSARLPGVIDRVAYILGLNIFDDMGQ